MLEKKIYEELCIVLSRPSLSGEREDCADVPSDECDGQHQANV